VDIHPPIPVALTLLSKFGDWPFRILAGLITTQTMRPDGSLLTEAGYDAATQLLLINPPQMAAIPETPTRADAEAALGLLKGLLSEFPFTVDEDGSSVSRAVGLSAIVSVICRGAFPVMPMHAVDAPAAGTGKSYLLSTVSWIATGQPMPIIAAGKTPEETEKRLGAAVIAGQSLITIDNVEGELGGDVLCQLIEQLRPKVRILGQSTLVEIDGRSMALFCNGNNITLIGDIYRRVVTCRLDAKVDRPEKRQFSKNPKRMILADRGAYVAACLTICRAYQVAGRPGRRDQIGSFNEWSDCVRSALVWLGEADTVDTMDDAVGEDPYVIAHQALLAEWHSVFGTRPVMLRDVAAKCDEVSGLRNEGTGALRFDHADLRAAVQATNPEAHRRGIDVNVFGQRMKQFRDRWVDGMCFVNRRSNGETTWSVRVGTERPVLKTKKKSTKSNA
jgi:putative DNA primase/helicase